MWMYIQLSRVRMMDPHRNEVCPSAFIWLKRGGSGCLIIISFLFPHYSLAQWFTRVCFMESPVLCNTR